jgi:DNA-binding NtrC family response regulator
MAGFEEDQTVKPKKILVVDDEYLIRWSLSQALSQQGYEVFSAEDGKKAIEALKTRAFDFIITDLVMPELDGWMVLESALKIWPQPRVIIISAHGGEGTRKVAIERGAWAYLEKPYVFDKIKELLDEPKPLRPPL